MHIIHQIIRCCVVLVIGLMTTDISVAQDKTVFRPTILEKDVPLTGQLEDVYTAMLYAFHGSTGDSVRVSMNELEDHFDPYLVLMSSNGGLLAYDDNSGAGEGGPAYSALISDFELPYDGSYYLLATSFNFIDSMMGSNQPAAVPLKFEIAVSGNNLPANPDFDPTMADYSALLPERGASTMVELTAQQPIAFVGFDGMAGDTVNLDAAAESFQPTPIMHLFTPDGRRLSMNEVLDGDSSTASLSEIELPATGRYLFMVMDVFFMDRLQDPSSTYGLGKLQISVG